MAFTLQSIFNSKDIDFQSRLSNIRDIPQIIPISKTILVEKPLFNKFYSLRIKKNKCFVGYNLRFHPVISYLKKIISKKKIWLCKVNCSSYLPDWRKNINYRNSASAKKKLGGGALLELSHELDYVTWLFGDIIIKYAFNKKISNLVINTDDIFSISATTSKKTFINVNVNFFSRIKKREIIVEGKNLSIHADLNENSINIVKNNVTKKLNFKNENTFKIEHQKILSGNYNKICSFYQGKKIIKLISKIKKLK